MTPTLSPAFISSILSPEATRAVAASITSSPFLPFTTNVFAPASTLTISPINLLTGSVTLIRLRGVGVYSGGSFRKHARYEYDAYHQGDS